MISTVPGTRIGNDDADYSRPRAGFTQFTGGLRKVNFSSTGNLNKPRHLSGFLRCVPHRLGEETRARDYSHFPRQTVS
jgi:hypothetical protein